MIVPILILFQFTMYVLSIHLFLLQVITILLIHTMILGLSYLVSIRISSKEEITRRFEVLLGIILASLITYDSFGISFLVNLINTSILPALYVIINLILWGFILGNIQFNIDKVVMKNE